jgi:2-keto-4-pentenoate hydratase/2-oxohepta-3-ene-1,7-dioic acid hydratase in catechol pathway
MAMRILRFIHKDYGARFGWLFDDMVGLIDGSIFDEYQRHEATLPISKVKILAPVFPEKIICVGRNYAAHAKERGASIPETPLLFLKPPSSIIANNDPIFIPPVSNQVEHEVELVVVIGKQGRWIPLNHALDYVFGYTIGNDLTARDLQNIDNQWTRAKGFDTFCPLGPWIETDLDPSDLILSCYVNAEMRQMGSTRDMIFGIPQLISYISSIMTLKPGDLIFTGTPSGVGQIYPGDKIDARIEGIGSLVNFVHQ